MSRHSEPRADADTAPVERHQAQLPTIEELRDGEALLWLESGATAWVRRREERIHFLDAWTIERETTIELDLSPEVVARLPVRHGRYLLPVKSLRRGQKLVVSAHDAEGRPLTRLSYDDERQLVTYGLMSLRRRLNLPQLGCSETRDYIKRPCWKNRVATDAWEWLARAMAHRRMLVVAIEIPSGGGRDGYQTHVVVRTAETLVQRKATMSLRVARRLSDNLRPHSLLRRIPFLMGSFLIADELRRGGRLLSCALMQVTRCDSFHLVFRSPPGTYVHFGHLVGQVLQPPARSDPCDPLAAPPDIRREATDLTEILTDPYPDMVHVSKRRKDRDWIEVDEETGFLALLRPATVGGMRAGWYTSLVISLSIAWVAVHIQLTPSTVDAEAIVAAMLIGPTLLGAVVTRQHRHAMTTDVLRSYRKRLALQAAMSFGVAITVASYSATTNTTGAGVPTLAQAFVWALLFLSLYATFRIGIAYWVSYLWLEQWKPRSHKGEKLGDLMLGMANRRIMINEPGLVVSEGNKGEKPERYKDALLIGAHCLVRRRPPPRSPLPLVRGVVRGMGRTKESTVVRQLFADAIGMDVTQEGGHRVSFAPRGSEHIETYGSADADDAIVGDGPVVSFLVDDFVEARHEMVAAGIEFIGDPQTDGERWWNRFRGADGDEYEIRGPT